MKCFALVFALFVVGCGYASAAERSPADVAGILAQLDARDGVPAEASRDDMTRMIKRASRLCVSNGKPSSATHVGDMVAYTHNQLVKDGVFVSRYNLLDVVYSILGDAKSHDCAKILGLYMTLRSDRTKHVSHINAYKAIQVMRDKFDL